jgi:hypothetical protein
MLLNGTSAGAPVVLHIAVEHYVSEKVRKYAILDNRRFRYQKFIDSVSCL